MELFREDGCMTDAGFRAMMDGQLDELGRLEAAEHLAYCDRCMDRYTALLTDDVLEQPPRSARGAVMGTIWIRLMQNTWGCAAVATVAAVLALTLLAYNRRVARRVVAISQEVQSIGAGNLYLQLEPKGRDELSQLTASVEQMRLSLLRKTSEEQRALQQNSDLITAMSHDIRNPLTALLGYLDLAKNGQYRSEEELQSFLDAAYGKAEQLKTLTDELFRYSLLFGCKELPMQMESYDARLLLEQLLGESRVQLQQQGFTVQLLLPQQEVQIEADVMYLKRVLDNLFDNIRKYADPAKPVAIAALIEDGALHICLSNSVNPASGRIESNKIGLRTCAKIMTQMAGGFRRYTENGKFTAEVILPIQAETCLLYTSPSPRDCS